MNTLSCSQQLNYNAPRSDEPMLSYSLKIVPRKKKTEYSVVKLHGMNKKFHSIDTLKEAVLNSCKEKISEESFGYIEPGHGAKGKQRWLTSSEDLKDLYRIHEGKKEILLWCFHADQGQKRCAPSPSGDGNVPKRSRYDNHLDKMTEVEEIEERLRERHTGDPYSEEQLRSWAHMIQLKKHSSYDEPPNKPFWKTRSQQKTSSSEITVSPGKRVNLRGQCVQQLLQLHELLEKGGISKEQYDEMQGAIMDEVKKY